MISLIKKVLGEKFKRSIKEQLGVPGLHVTLQMLKSRGFDPKFVIDGGAYEGQWAIDFLEVFPGTKILMLEAQASKADRLNKVIEQYPSVQWHNALLSAEDGKKLFFIEDETASHVDTSIKDAEGGHVSETIDAIIERKKLNLPDFIKLDVQGFELEVLAGAEKSLANAEFCLLEVSLLNIGNDPLLIDVITFMDKRNFQAYDICQFMRRPYDKALHQIDLLFIKKDSALIKDKRWN